MNVFIILYVLHVYYCSHFKHSYDEELFSRLNNFF